MADEIEDVVDAEEVDVAAPVAKSPPPVAKKPPPEPQEEPEEEECPPCKAGAPAWMATFADMATLLMAFFVLLLSFAQMNVPKYKEVSGSMNEKFGVQKIVPVVEQPIAENIIAKQYKTSKVDPTLLDVIQEQTTDEIQPDDVELKSSTKANDSETNSQTELLEKTLAKEIAEGKVKINVKDKKIVVEVISKSETGTSGQGQDAKSSAKVFQDDLEIYAKVALAQAQVASQIEVVDASPDSRDDNLAGQSSQSGEQAVEDQYQRIRAKLSNEITQGLAEVERDGDKIIVRLAERGSFRSGFADLQQGFKPLLDKVGESIADSSGLITIEGHTDNVPMAFSERFRSNWDLSAARSAAVADYLLERSPIDDGRVSVTGLADTRPIASNDTPAGRSKNRRIEVIIDGS
jgi:chemotaxis protein MotB